MCGSQHPELVMHWDLVSSVAICVAQLLLKGHGECQSLVYNTWERTHTPHGHKTVNRKNTHKLIPLRIRGVPLTSHWKIPRMCPHCLHHMGVYTSKRMWQNGVIHFSRSALCAKVWFGS